MGDSPQGNTANLPDQERVWTKAMMVLAGQSAFAAINFFVVLLLNRLGSQVDAGRYLLAVGITMPLFRLASLQLITVQATDVLRLHRFAAYMRLRLVCLAIAAVATLIIAGLMRDDTVAMWVLLIFAASRSLEGISDACHGEMQRSHQMVRMGISLFIRSMLAMVGFACVFYFTSDLVLAMLSFIVAAGFILLHDLPQAIQLDHAHTPDKLKHPPHPEGKVEEARRLIHDAWPLGVTVGLISITAYLPLYFLEAFTGKEAVGKFGSMLMFIFGLGLLILAMGQALNPTLARLWQEGKTKALSQRLRQLLLLATGMGILGIALAALAGTNILRLAFGSGYEKMGTIFLILTVSGLFHLMGAAVTYGIFASRQFTRFILPYTVVLVLSAFAHGIWTTRFGLYGAAWVTLATNFLIALSLSLTCLYLLKRHTTMIADPLTNDASKRGQS